jgi:hypothetical protein
MNLTIGRWESWGYSTGLALLYTSAFYLPSVGLPQNYWLPNPTREILFPTIVGTLILIPLVQVALMRYLHSQTWSLARHLPIIILTLLAVVGAFSAVGYSAPYLIVVAMGGEAALETTRWSRMIIFVAACVAIGAGLAMLPKRRATVVRFLATLGYTYAVLAVFRAGYSPATAESRAHEASHIPTARFGPSSSSPQTLARPRQVVWIIFDELDFNETLGSINVLQGQSMPNLLALSRSAVSATQAYTPARDTEVSLPSLLLGVAPKGVKYDQQGLLIHARDGTYQPFDESNSVFAQLPGGPRSGAVLGYYHPYCTVFPSTTPCLSWPMANVGRWYDALLPFSQPIAGASRWIPGSGKILPGAFFRMFEPMYRISDEMVQRFPDFLRLRASSLVFIHVNLPHAPGDYSQRALHFATVTDDRAAYRRNLRVVDEMVDVAIRILSAQSKDRDILLIVSSDHWHRINSLHAAQPVPWIAWHVGEENTGAVLNQKISTVHTADLILDFLRGSVESQRDILAWWQGKIFYPPLMPDHYKD